MHQETLALPSRSAKEEVTAFVISLLRKELPGKTEFDVETRNMSSDFVC
jgi:hypothetical protein